MHWSKITKGTKVTLKKWRELGYSAPPRMYVTDWFYDMGILKLHGKGSLAEKTDYVKTVVVSMTPTGTLSRYEKPEDIEVDWQEE